MAVKKLVKMALLALLPAALLMGTAGDPLWWIGWVYLALLLALTFGSRAAVNRIHPGLLEERASSFRREDTKGWDRVVVSILVGLCPPATWILAGLDHRAGALLPRSPVLLALGFAVFVAGGLLTAWAMVANRFFSAVVRIQHDREHVVVSTGPYRFVRHPGYLGAGLVGLATPVLLQSAMAWVPTLISTAALLYRTAREDRTLEAELDGYPAYAARTRYRLVPGFW